jgi:TPP-dependent pyruvate/acetoin dehydrogenase alpha subunit
MTPRASAVTGTTASVDLHLELFRRMVAIRYFEDRAEKHHHDGQISGPFHSCAGQEAVAVGVCAALRADDVVTSTHRGHGHAIAKGADLRRMWAELRGARDGYCHGLGGSMHLADMGIGMIGENGIVGASVYLATGAALGFQLQGVDRVALAFTGDGALAQGVLFESLTLAQIWALPVVFVVEDNQYAHSFPSRRLGIKSTDADWWAPFGVAGARVDGTDVLNVLDHAERAVERARAGEGATFLHIDCYRWRGHNLNDAHLLYRTQEEVTAGRLRDPIRISREALANDLSEEEIEAVRRSAEEAVDRAWDEAAIERPDPSLVFDGVPG